MSDERVTVDAQAAATEALAICAECRSLDEAALSGDPAWMGDGEDIWQRTNRLLALIEPVAEGYVALAARLEAAETERDQLRAWAVTFDAKREPMFQDQYGGGWVPLAKHDEDIAALVGLLADAEKALRLAASKPCSYWGGHTCEEMGFIDRCASCEAREAVAAFDAAGGEHG